MAFAYYQRLSPRKRAIYRRSAAIQTLEVPAVEQLHPLVAALEAKLASAQRRALSTAAKRLLKALTERLGVAELDVIRVLAVRPSDATSELHGLYERDEDGRTRITVWMQTAAHARVVAFRTFLRTLLHELCHHVDYELFELADSYHTEGFFARESSLMRQLAPVSEQAAPRLEQLELPWAPQPVEAKRARVGGRRPSTHETESKP
jgi:hypothetical protein